MIIVSNKEVAIDIYEKKKKVLLINFLGMLY